MVQTGHIVYRTNRVHGLHLGSLVDPTLPIVEPGKECGSEKNRPEPLREGLEADEFVFEDMADKDVISPPDDAAITVDLSSEEIVGVIEISEFSRISTG